MTIEHLPGTKINPLAILGRTMEAEPNKVIVISCHGDQWRVGWSNMQMIELAYGLTVADIIIKRAIDGSIEK